MEVGVVCPVTISKIRYVNLSAPPRTPIVDHGPCWVLRNVFSDSFIVICGVVVVHYTYSCVF